MVLAGAAIHNGNRGVEALGRSVADALDRYAPQSVLSILDDGWGTRTEDSRRYRQISVEFVGVRRSRRWYRPESWAQVRVAQALGTWANPVARKLARADAVLDLSAGDSFTDLYGPARLASVSAPKKAAIRAGRPLVLLPQTYGPFSTVPGRKLAEDLVQAATIAYARDAWSYDRLLELAGDGADTNRLRRGVDVAFALEPRRPPAAVEDHLADLSGHVVAGVNVSGLLRTRSAAQRFGLAGDYLSTITELVQRLVKAGAHVLFVPHVHTAEGAGESDITAINSVRSNLSTADASQTSILPAELDAAQIKWCLAKLSWFIGSRMHSTIGALSSFVPTFSYAYSDKARGVFESCDMVDQAADARELAGPAAVESMMLSFDERDGLAQRLSTTVPPVIEQSRKQLQEAFDDIYDWKMNRADSDALG